MTSDICRVSPESKSFVENAIEFFQNRVSSEILQLLLTNDKAWEIFVAEANLSRDEADVLHKGLNKRNTEQLNRKKFLNEFPRVKQELEERIKKLHMLADKVDKVHRDCTISNVVTSSTNTVSGILTILGLALAPVTAGFSLALSATGIGLGAAAAVANVSTSIVEEANKVTAKIEASSLSSTDIDKWEMVEEIVSCLTVCISLSEEIITAVKKIGKNIRAIKLANANPLLVAQAKILMSGGRISVKSSMQVQEVFGGTALAMTKQAQMLGVATAGVFLLVDVYKLVKESVHLHEGAKADLAEELRQQAQELKRKLEKLTQIHEILQ